jgi:hypothetical protein
LRREADDARRALLAVGLMIGNEKVFSAGLLLEDFDFSAML